MFAAFGRLFRRNLQKRHNLREARAAKRRENLLYQSAEQDIPLVCRICANNGGCMVGVSSYPKHGFGPPSYLVTGSFSQNSDIPEGCPLLYPGTPLCRAFPGAYETHGGKTDQEFPDAS